MITADPQSSNEAGTADSIKDVVGKVGEKSHESASTNQNCTEERQKQTEVSALHLWGILGSLWVGVLLVALDETMIATIAVSITTSLHSFSSYSWLTTTYVLGSSVSQAISGYLTDLFGRRNGLIVCYCLFAIGILLCGVARNLPVFLVGRVLQGLGGGSVCSITAYIETDLIPIERRAFIEGLANVCYGVVLALGGLYGAAIDAAIGWKWAFLIQLPIVVIDGIIVLFALQLPDEKKDKDVIRQTDILGIICFLGAIVCFEFSLNSGSINLVWSTPLVITPLAVAAASFIFFIFWESKVAKNPVVPIKSITGRTVASILISTFLSTGCFVGCMFYISLYIEILGMSNVATGLRFIPLSVLFAFGSIVTGYIVQFTHRYYFLNIALQVISAGGYGLLCKLDFNTPSWQPFVFLGILGIGIGGTYVTNLMGILTSIPNKEQATVQAVAWSVRAIGIVSALTISSVIFQTVSREHLHRTLQDDNLVKKFSNTIALDSPAFSSLSHSIQQTILNGYMEATRAVFYFLLAQAVGSIFVSLFLEDNTIKQTDNTVES